MFEITKKNKNRKGYIKIYFNNKLNKMIKTHSKNTKN